MTETRPEIETRLTELRQQRGAAKLDGKKFDDAKIAALETSLEAFDDVAGEKARREREQAAAEWEAQQTELRSQLSRAYATFLGDVQDANTALRTYADTLKRVRRGATDMARLYHAITGRSVPSAMIAPEVDVRMAGRLAATMIDATWPQQRLAHLKWVGASLHSAADDWRSKEAAILEPHLKPILLEKD